MDPDPSLVSGAAADHQKRKFESAPVIETDSFTRDFENIVEDYAQVLPLDGTSNQPTAKQHSARGHPADAADSPDLLGGHRGDDRTFSHVPESDRLRMELLVLRQRRKTSDKNDAAEHPTATLNPN